MHLGVFENFVGFVCNATIEYDIFKVRSASLAARTQMSVGRLEADLLAWCRRDRVANPDRPQYPLQNFTVREPPRARSAQRKLRQERLFITRRIWCAASLTSCHRELSFFLLGEPWSGTFRSLGARQGTCLSANNKISWMRTRDTLFLAVCALPWIPKHHLMLHMVVRYRDHRTSAWVKARTNSEIQFVCHLTYTDVLTITEPVLLVRVLGRRRQPPACEDRQGGTHASVGETRPMCV